ncbi:DHH family phosphoesterase [Sporosarcina sp. G11-34]|uniref:DHH family phosphoesterase n=1 Tax=Sporosarcina sp. G11-34 TaxID=2849605 RepID=UPI0022A95A06|nr:bifunctional oligoribonuclease/PAP phosphatase NrnA [Sporosarcina sp. G11-34]MCZ2257984.1 bifunctional oligoribonuclease/PAP phosphatase NrnA [Sporosarcina sp. G11-34]
MKRQIIDTIEKYNKIIILRHVRPDPDAYGSQIGLKEIIQKNYPDKEVLAGGEHEESLSYLAKPDVINRSHYKDALVIITDTGNTERIDGEFYNESELILKIDHHPDADPYGDVRWVDTGASSTSEMITSLFEEGEKSFGWKMPDNAARLLFAGIVGDTGRFMFPSTTDKTFDRASELIKYDFDRAELFAGMYEVERKILHLQGYIYQNFEIDENGAAFIKLDQKTLEKFQVSPSETSQLVGSLGEVKGICAWAILIEESDQIRVRLRSKKPVINALAAQYGGGGHPLASGASVHSWEEADELITKLKELCIK